MAAFFSQLFDTSDFPARWHCGRWTLEHGTLHIASDLLIWGAYCAIPLAFVYCYRRRKSLEFPRVFWLFTAFIFACGSTHLIEAIIFYWPIYRVSGLFKLGTAVVSWATVFALIPALPRALLLPGMERQNDQLQREIAQRRLAEERLQQMNLQLEQAVSHQVDTLRRSEQHLVLAQRAARLATWELHPQRGELQFGEEWRSLYQRETLNGHLVIDEWLELVHPGDRLRAARDLERAIHGDGDYESEFRIVLPNGGERTLLAQGQRTESSDGAEFRLCGIHLDISHRKALEEQLAVQVDEEKQRISAELHDGLGQQLTGLGMLAKSLQRSLEADGSRQAAGVGELATAIPQIVRELRRMVWGLMPVEMDAQGLVAALNRLSAGVSRQFPVACRLECPEDVELDDKQVSQQFFRIAQESVNNAIKHARASEIVIRLRDEGDELQLCVRDNGVGMTLPHAEPTGNGMRILRHRAARIGARLTIRSQPGKGTDVCCRWNRLVADGRSTWSSMESADP